MPLIIIAAGVALLLVLMIGFKVNGFIALVLVAAVVGFAEGMGAQDVLHSIQNGIGGTLGGLAMILGFGAMLGRLISDTGAAQRIATTLINTFGKKTRAMGAGDHRAYRRHGNVLKSDSYCCCRSFYDCGLIGTAIAVCRGSNGRRLIRYALLPAAASRPYRYCDNFLRQISVRPCCMG